MRSILPAATALLLSGSAVAEPANPTQLAERSRAVAPARIERMGGPNPICPTFQHPTQQFVPGMPQREMRIYRLFLCHF